MEDIAAARVAPEIFIDSYARLDYRRRYAGLLRQHLVVAEAIAELCLFHFWLACHAHRRAEAPAQADAPLHVPPGWPLPRQVDGVDIEDALGSRVERLLESRFDLYERFARLGRNDNDPVGLDAAALALSHQLFVQPAGPMRAWLRTQARELFERLSAVNA